MNWTLGHHYVYDLEHTTERHTIIPQRAPYAIQRVMERGGFNTTLTTDVHGQIAAMQNRVIEGIGSILAMP